MKKRVSKRGYQDNENSVEEEKNDHNQNIHHSSIKNNQKNL